MSFQDLSGRSANHLPTVLLSNRYRVLSVLGDGGFGKTFLVEDTHMPSNKRCVLKQLKPVRDRPEVAQLVRDRFEREAATLEMLGEAHDQIPRLYAHFEEEGEFYLVEEWIDGITLTQKVQQEGSQSETSVQRMIANLLPVIAYIHAQKMVHRDIKPDNIILRHRDGKPVLIDFGAVKETMKTVISSVESSAQSIIVGTPGYMPIEQISGRPVYASDIYSLGVTAIYMLTGKHPQDLQTDPGTGNWNWRDYASNIGDDFTRFLNRAVQSSAHNRFPNTGEMQVVLERLVNGEASVSNPSQSLETPTSKTIASSRPSAQLTEVVSFSNPVSSSTQLSKRPFNSFLVVGSLVSIGILIGGLWVQNNFSEAFVSGSESSDAANESVEPVQESSTSAVRDTTTETDQVVGGEDPSVSNPTSGASSTVPTNIEPLEELQNSGSATAELPEYDSLSTSNAKVIGDHGFHYLRKELSRWSLAIGNVDVDSRIRVIDSDTDPEGRLWYQVLVPSDKAGLLGIEAGWIPEQFVQLDAGASPSLPDPPSSVPQRAVQ